MSFNVEELEKIKHAVTSSAARKAVSASLQAIKPRIEAAKLLDLDKRQQALTMLVSEALAARHEALQSGASSYSDPAWAAPAACESWLHELINGTPEDILRIEQLVAELSTVDAAPDKERTTDWPVLLFLFVALPFAFTYGGLWIGIFVLVVGMTALGWSRRHKGPFPTNPR